MKTTMPIKMAGFWITSYLSGAFTNWSLDPGTWSVESRAITAIIAGALAACTVFAWIIEKDVEENPIRRGFHPMFPPVCPPVPQPPEPPCGA